MCKKVCATENLTRLIACLMVRSAWADLASTVEKQSRSLSFEWWLGMTAWGLSLWNVELHAGVHRRMRKVSMADVRKDQWNGMQINGSNTGFANLDTNEEMRKEVLHNNTHFTCGVIVATKCDILIRRTWAHHALTILLGWNFTFYNYYMRIFCISYTLRCWGCFCHLSSM